MYLKLAQENVRKVKQGRVSDTSCWYHHQLAIVVIWTLLASFGNHMGG